MGGQTGAGRLDLLPVPLSQFSKDHDKVSPFLCVMREINCLPRMRLRQCDKLSHLSTENKAADAGGHPPTEVSRTVGSTLGWRGGWTQPDDP